MSIKNFDKFFDLNRDKVIVPKMIMHCGELFERVPYGYVEHDIIGDKCVCPRCGCSEGELHEIGCSHEICPICEGMLAICSCEFFIV